MKRIFRLFFLFLIPFFLIRFATLAETDPSTGFFIGGKYGLIAVRYFAAGKP